jgi:hypothetical protein
MARPIADFVTDRQLGPPLGQPLPQRPCGGCRQCCITMPVVDPQLRKAAGVPCNHLGPGGCSLYPDWPSICRKYQCAWKMIKELPEEARPDKCGVIFTLYYWDESQPEFLRSSVIATAVNAPSDFDHPAARACLDTLIRGEAMTVWLHHDRRLERLFPDPDLADAMLSPETTPHRHLLGRAAALRRKWEISAAATRPIG